MLNFDDYILIKNEGCSAKNNNNNNKTHKIMLKVMLKWIKYYIKVFEYEVLEYPRKIWQNGLKIGVEMKKIGFL